LLRWLHRSDSPNQAPVSAERSSTEKLGALAARRAEEGLLTGIVDDGPLVHKDNDLQLMTANRDRIFKTILSAGG
jgi:hypothetical protein